jgi:hypothetical protein
MKHTQAAGYIHVAKKGQEKQKPTNESSVRGRLDYLPFVVDSFLDSPRHSIDLLLFHLDASVIRCCEASWMVAVHDDHEWMATTRSQRCHHQLPYQRRLLHAGRHSVVPIVRPIRVRMGKQFADKSLS